MWLVILIWVFGYLVDSAYDCQATYACRLRLRWRREDWRKIRMVQNMGLGH